MNREQRHHHRKVLFGLLYRVYDTNANRWKFRLNFKFIAILALVSALILWLGASVTIYSYYKYAKKFDEISFANVVKMPFNIDRFRVEMGEFNIRQAKKFLDARDYQNALIHLYSGVARSPDNLGARMELAMFFLYLMQDTEKAAEIMSEKMPLAYEKKDKRYILSGIAIMLSSDDTLENAINVASSALNDNIASEKEIISSILPIIKSLDARKEYEKIGNLCSDMASRSSSPIFQRFCAQNGAVAFLSNSEPDKAQKLLYSFNIRSGSVYAQTMAFNLWNSGHEINALKILNSLVKKTKNPSPIYKILSVWHADMGNKKASEECKRMAALSSKSDIDAEFYYLDSELDAKAYLSKFEKIFKKAKSIDTLLRLMKSAVYKNNVEAVNMCLKHGLKNAPPSFDLSMKMLEVEYALNKGDTHEAALKLNAVKIAASKMKKKYNQQSYEGMEMIAKIMSHESPEPLIKDFYKKHADTPKNILAIVKFLNRLNMRAEALSLIDMLARDYPSMGSAGELKATLIFESKDYCSFVEFVADSSSRIPLKLLNELDPKKISSDAFVFITPEKLDKARAKIADAGKKLDKYRREIAPN